MSLQTKRQTKSKRNYDRERDLVKSLAKFYRDRPEYEKYLDKDSEEGMIAGRIIEYFIITYASEHNTVIDTSAPEYNNGKTTFDESGNVVETPVSIFNSYKRNVSSYSKKYFDCFCRNKSENMIEFYLHSQEKTIEITLGRLNLYRWCIRNKVFTYIIDHYDDINEDMIQHKKERMVIKSNGKKITGTRKYRNYKTTITVSFD